MQNKAIVKFIKKLTVLLFWIAVWFLIALIVDQEVLVASPKSVLLRLQTLVGKRYFWDSAFHSLVRILAGWLLGVVVGLVISIVTHKSILANNTISPLFTVIRATPVASFIILALVWLKTGDIPVFTSFLMVLPILWGNMTSGLDNIDKDLVEVSRVFEFSLVDRLRRVYIPMLMPHFISGCMTSLGLAWKAGIAAEILCKPQNSIGKYIYESKLYLETADLFAWTALVIVLSMILEKSLIFLVKRVRKRFGMGAEV